MALLQALVAAAVTAVAAGLRIATMPGSSLYQNPVLNASAPDPGVLFDPATGLYWAAVTSNDDPNHFPLYSSPDLVSWTAQGVLFPAGDEPVWAKQMNRDWWAPEVHIMPDGSYVAYYVTRNNDGVLSIGAAVSASRSMAGPWVDIGQPLIASKPDGQIDATYFRDVNAGGQGYIVWKEDANSVGRPTTIYATPVSDSGRNITGDSIALFANDPSSWEGAVTEGPWVINQGGFYYVFYSGNAYNTPAYAVGVARATAIGGPYTKDAGNPILHSASASPAGLTFYGPGHCSVVLSQAGNWSMVYHAWNSTGAARVMLLDTLRPTDDGWWTIGDPEGLPSTGPEVTP